MEASRSVQDRLAGWSCSIAVAIALACALNAFSFTLLSANPLIQSDVWRYLDGFLGRFVEHGFALRDLFMQEAPSDTNFPLYKLFLFLNARYFGLDLRLDAVLAVSSATAGVLLLAKSASGKPWSAWGVREAWLLAVLALLVLSLNSTVLYTWPLAGLWFLPLLVGFAYIAWMPAVAWPGLVALAFALGVLLDEFALPVAAAALAGNWFGRRLASGSARAIVATLAGLGLSRIFYSFWHVGTAPASDAAHVERSMSAFFSPEVWKAVVIPLANSVVQRPNLQHSVQDAADAAAFGVAFVFVVAHAWFWWRAVKARASAHPDSAVAVATAVMLLFYALVAGMVAQRVAQFGYDYLHQPRYVVFYQLHLAALAILLYRDRVSSRRGGRWGRVVVPTGVTALIFLQVHLSSLAWPQTKYVSAYYQQSAHQIAALATDPTRRLECVPIVRVCEFSIEKRQRIMRLLVEHELNLFAPNFQALHRIYPGLVPETLILHQDVVRNGH